MCMIVLKIIKQEWLRYIMEIGIQRHIEGRVIRGKPKISQKDNREIFVDIYYFTYEVKIM